MVMWPAGGQGAAAWAGQLSPRKRWPCAANCQALPSGSHPASSNIITGLENAISPRSLGSVVRAAHGKKAVPEKDLSACFPPNWPSCPLSAQTCVLVQKHGARPAFSLLLRAELDPEYLSVEGEQPLLNSLSP